MDAFAAKETINSMLRSSRLTPEQLLGEASRSEDQSGVCGPCVRCLTWMIFDGSCIVEDADIFTFLRSPLNLLPYRDERRDRFNRTA